jgi:hypothetical protein
MWIGYHAGCVVEGLLAFYLGNSDSVARPMAQYYSQFMQNIINFKRGQTILLEPKLFA